MFLIVEMLFILFAIVFIVSQILVPAFKNQPIFPFLRKTQEKVMEAKLELQKRKDLLDTAKIQREGRFYDSLTEFEDSLKSKGPRRPGTRRSF
jgi:hypothetical protein